MHRTIDDHYSEYRHQGYTVFRGYLPADRIQEIRQTVDPEFHRRHAEHPDRILGISEQTYYRWRKQYGGMEVSQARRLKELEQENGRLKRLVADQALDLSIHKESNARRLNGGIYAQYIARVLLPYETTEAPVTNLAKQPGPRAVVPSGHGGWVVVGTAEHPGHLRHQQRRPDSDAWAGVQVMRPLQR